MNFYLLKKSEYYFTDDILIIKIINEKCTMDSLLVFEFAGTGFCCNYNIFYNIRVPKIVTLGPQQSLFNWNPWSSFFFNPSTTLLTYLVSRLCLLEVRGHRHRGQRGWILVGGTSWKGGWDNGLEFWGDKTTSWQDWTWTPVLVRFVVWKWPVTSETPSVGATVALQEGRAVRCVNSKLIAA